jgi:hypothetical protein
VYGGKNDVFYGYGSQPTRGVAAAQKYDDQSDAGREYHGPRTDGEYNAVWNVH